MTAGLETGATIRAFHNYAVTILALPNNLFCFERHESIWMVRDDARRVVARRARCGDLG
jgi:hypothetical protein